MQQLIKQSTTALHPSDPTTSSSSIHHYRVSFSPPLQEVALLFLSSLESLFLWLLLLCGLEKLQFMLSLPPSQIVNSSLWHCSLKDFVTMNSLLLCGEHLNFASRRKVKASCYEKCNSNDWFLLFHITTTTTTIQTRPEYSATLGRSMAIMFPLILYMNICLSHVEQYNL